MDADVKLSWAAVELDDADVKLTFIALSNDVGDADVKLTFIALSNDVGDADVKLTWLCARHVASDVDVRISWVALSTGLVALSLYPDVGDVRVGLAYGPTGTEFIGTMVSSGGSYVRRR